MTLLVCAWMVVLPQEDRIDRLIQRLSDDSVEVRDSAEQELRREGAVIEDRLVAALPGAGAEAAERIRRLLSHIRFDPILPPFVPLHYAPALAALLSEDEGDRVKAVRELREAGDRAVADVFARMMSDPSAAVRRAAAEGLVQSPRKEAAEEFVKMLEAMRGSFDMGYRRPRASPSQAASALRWIGPIVVDRVVERLSSKNAYVRIDAAWVLQEWAAPETAAALLTALEDDDEVVRALAARGLAKMKTEAAREPFQKLLNGDDLLLELIAANGLSQLGVADLKQAVRDARTVALTGFYDEDLMPEAHALMLREGDADMAVLAFSGHRWNDEDLARAAVRRIGVPALCDATIRKGHPDSFWPVQDYLPSEELRTVCLQRLASDSRSARLFSLDALKEDPTAEALPAVLRILASDDQDVRDAAAEFIAGHPSDGAIDTVRHEFRRNPSPSLARAYVAVTRGTAVGEIVEAIRGERLPMNGWTLGAFALTDSTEATDYLAGLLSAEYWRDALRCLERQDTPHSRLALRDFLARTESSDQAEAVLVVLQEWGDRESITTVRAWIDRLPDPAIEALGVLGDADSADEFLRRAGSSDEAVWSLARVGDRRALEIVRPQLLSRERDERERAVIIAGWLRDRDSFDTISRMVRYEDPEMVLRSLARIDPARTRAIGWREFDRTRRQDVLRALIPCFTTEDVSRLKSLLAEPYLAYAAARGLSAAALPTETKETRLSGACRNAKSLIENLKAAFGGSFSASDRVLYIGRVSRSMPLTLKEALSSLREDLGWIPSTNGIRIVTWEEALDHWRKQ